MAGEDLSWLPPLQPALPEDRAMFDAAEPMAVEGLPEGVEVRTSLGGLITYFLSTETGRIRQVPLASDEAEYLIDQARQMLEAEQRYFEKGIPTGL